jgi:PTS system cellobiose-specific IIB component
MQKSSQQLHQMQIYKLAEKNPDILMLGPQVRYLEGNFKEKLDIPVEVINMQDYGMMNGEKVLKEALTSMGV